MLHVGQTRLKRSEAKELTVYIQTPSNQFAAL